MTAQQSSPKVRTVSSSHRETFAGIARSISRGLWLYVIPALLAALVLRFLVPAAGVGFAGWIANAGHSQPVLLLTALFLVFSAMAHYWRFRLPGGLETAAILSARRSGRGALGTLATLAAGVSVVLGVRAKLAEPYQVLTSSMLPTLAPTDRIAANKLAYRTSTHLIPPRGDVVVFRSAAVALAPGTAPPVLVKRVIGHEGDRIEMLGGTPVINGWQVPSCAAGPFLEVLPDGEGGLLRGQLRVEFLGDHPYLTVHSFPMPSLKGPYVVRPGEVFVLGDNRANSSDSRVWNSGRGGGAPLSAIEGRAQWFLVGTHRSGEADLSRFLRPLDVLEQRVHLEGFNAIGLEEGIAKCLRERPTRTFPPPAGEPGTAEAAAMRHELAEP